MDVQHVPRLYFEYDKDGQYLKFSFDAIPSTFNVISETIIAVCHLTFNWITGLFGSLKSI